MLVRLCWLLIKGPPPPPSPTLFFQEAEDNLCALLLFLNRSCMGDKTRKVCEGLHMHRHVCECVCGGWKMQSVVISLGCDWMLMEACVKSSRASAHAVRASAVECQSCCQISGGDHVLTTPLCLQPCLLTSSSPRPFSSSWHLLCTEPASQQEWKRVSSGFIPSFLDSLSRFYFSSKWLRSFMSRSASAKSYWGDLSLSRGLRDRTDGAFEMHPVSAPSLSTERARERGGSR